MGIMASATGRRLARPLLLAALGVGAVGAANAFEWQVNDSYWSLSGYGRQYLTWNLEDSSFPRGDDQFDMRMFRTQVRGDIFGRNLFQLPAGGVDFFMGVRLVYEKETDFQDRLANDSFTNPAGDPAEFGKLFAPYSAGGGNAIGAVRYGAFNALNGSGENLVPRINAAAPGTFAPQAFLQRGDYTDYYEWYQFPVRELYLDIPITSRLKARVGKQLVVWGDTDFFTVSDSMHGIDFSWGVFGEGAELEELRKPLFLANFEFQVPEADGALQVVVRPPGVDRDEDIGNTFDIFGGRNANHENKGIDFTNFLNLNYKHSEGDVDSDVTGGARWSGRWRDFGYAFQYLHTFNQEPMVNTCTAGPNCFWSNAGFAPVMRTPLGGDQPVPDSKQLVAPVPFAPIAGGLYLGDIIYPIVDTVGMNANAYVPFLDAVFATEFAYIFDKPYQTGSLRNPTCQFVFCGLAGILEKDTVKFSMRLDWQAQWTQRAPLGKIPVIGTHRPSFITVTVFDSWLPGFDKDDDIVAFVGNADKLKEHQPLGTLIMSMPYFNDRMTVGLAAGMDLASFGNGFLIPSVDVAYGDHWRLKMEWDFLFNDDYAIGGEARRPPNLTEPFSTRGQGSRQSLFGINEGNSAFQMRLTYLF